MNGHDQMESDDCVERIRHALRAMPSGGRSEAILGRIAGRSPAEMCGTAQVRHLRRLTGVAALILLLLLGLGITEGNDRPVTSQTDPLPIFTLEEDGFGTYSSAAIVLEEILIGEAEE